MVATTEPALADMPHPELTRATLTRCLAVLGNPAVRPPPDIVEKQAHKHAGRHAAQVAEWIKERIDLHEDRALVIGGHARAVLAVIAQQLSQKPEDDGIWALGMIDPWDLADEDDLLSAIWDRRTIAWAVGQAVAALNDAAAADRIMTGDFAGPGASVPRESLGEHRPLQHLIRIHRFGPHLLHSGLRAAVRNLAAWVVRLAPERAPDLLHDEQHPVLAAFVAWEAASVLRRQAHDRTLEWIHKDSSEQLVAACIHETLSIAAMLRRDEHDGPRFLNHVYATPLRPEASDFDDVIEGLIGSLVARIAGLGGPRAGRWLGELLASAASVYPASDQHSGDMDRLVEAAVQCGASLLKETDDFEATLIAVLEGLRTPPRSTNVRHLEPMASQIAGDVPERALALRRALLDDLRDQMAKGRDGHYHVDAGEHGRAWTLQLGKALGELAIIEGDAAAAAFLGEIFAELGLSIWDLEEDHEHFMQDASIAQHLFTVGALAASHAYERSPAAGSALCQWIVDRYWPCQKEMSRTYVVGDHVSWAPPTVMAAMLQCHPNGWEMAAKLLDGPHVPPRALAVAASGGNDGLKDAARQELVARFEDRWALSPMEASEWAQVFNEIGDPERGLRALSHLPLEDHRRASASHQLLALRLALTLLETEGPSDDDGSPHFTTDELRQLAVECHSRLRTAHPQLREDIDDLELRMRQLDLIR